MVQHCLRKILSETGFIHRGDLTEMESKVLSNLLLTKASFSADSGSDMAVLNKAIDKIVCHVKSLQLQSQKYQQVVLENHNLKSGLRNLIKTPENSPAKDVPPKIDRPIDEIGLSTRTVRLLRSYGIDTLEQLRACHLSRLRNQARVGVKTIHEIETILLTYSV